jgi:hypothetical protein
MCFVSSTWPSAIVKAIVAGCKIVLAEADDECTVTRRVSARLRPRTEIIYET